jgi:queuosine biosynthesis protein QueC
MWINYGQRNAAAEFKAVTNLCKANGIYLKIVDAQHIFDGCHSAILKSDDCYTHTVETDELQNRNAVLINIAAAHCSCRTTIVVAAHRTPAPYPDCHPTFYTRMAKALSFSTNGKVDVEAPFIRLTKFRVLKKGWEAGMSREDMEATVSCYEGNNCGECPACKSRREAIAKLFY